MVLARYNLVGIVAVLVVTAGLVGVPVLAWVFVVTGERDQGPLLMGAGLVWIVLMIVAQSASAALGNIVANERRAVFVEDDTLIYNAPAMPGGFRLRSFEIASAAPGLSRGSRAKPEDSLKGRAMEVVHVGLANGGRKEIAAYALDVGAGTLAASIEAFAKGRSA